MVAALIPNFFPSENSYAGREKIVSRPGYEYNENAGSR